MEIDKKDIKEARMENVLRLLSYFTKFMKYDQSLVFGVRYCYGNRRRLETW